MYMNIPTHERICTACNSGEIEDEEHLILSCRTCSLYTCTCRPLKQKLCSKLVKLNFQCLNLEIMLDNHNHYILKTRPCDLYPLTPHFYIVNWGLQGYTLFSYFCSKTSHFYIVKLGFTGVCIFFSIFALKHRLWVLVRTASLRRF